MIHIISDLNINYQDFAKEQDIISQPCSYIIVTGNFCKENKRSMIYIEKLSRNYPDAHIIFNFGLFDVMGKPYEGIRSMLDVKINEFKKFDKNIYFPLKPQIIGNYDFLCTFGWCYISDEEEFKRSNLVNETIISWDGEFYIDDVLMSKKFPKVYTIDFVNEQAALEEETIRQWLNIDNGKQKILVTAQGPDSENIFKTTNVEVFPNLDLSGIVWVTGGVSDYVGDYKNCRLIKLPGLDRSRFLPESVLDI